LAKAQIDTELRWHASRGWQQVQKFCGASILALTDRLIRGDTDEIYAADL
jgi:hypothetical protein